MALHLTIPSPPCSLKRFSLKRVPLISPSCVGVTRQVRVQSVLTEETNVEVERRTANYKPSIWDDNFIQSLEADYTGEIYVRRAEKLKEDVRHMFDKRMDIVAKLELIDTLQFLGVAHHFKKEIKATLDFVASNLATDAFAFLKEDLYAVSLKFRLLRQHGYLISQDVFKSFKDEKNGGFKESITKDIKGMLSFYEASFHSIGEDILDEAREFTIKHLKDIKGDVPLDLKKQVKHALELPFHWRAPRFEARWFIETYKLSKDMNPSLLEFAKLDFNMVQELHQQELKEVSRWWKDLGLGDKMDFARDRLVETFFWGVGVASEPELEFSRKQFAKILSLATTIDDLYDVYGTLDELKLFTNAIERWDINAIGDLPNYMKLCFLALYNTTNDMAYELLKEQGWDVIHYLKKAWIDICKGYMIEAEWFYSGHKPKLEEYLNNAWMTVTGPLLLVNVYFSLKQNITKEALDGIENYADLIRWSCMIFRLADDEGTSSDELKRGDVPKTLQLYMHETGASEEMARQYVKNMIIDVWKNINRARFSSSPFPETYINCALNLARTSQCFYQHGDGFGVQDRETKERITSLLIEPISLIEE